MTEPKTATDRETREAALQMQNETLVAQRDAALAAEKAARDEMTEREVDALIGEKILSFEKGDFLELARTNRPLFARMVAARGPLGILLKIVTPEKSATNTAANAGPAADLASLAPRRA